LPERYPGEANSFACCYGAMFSIAEQYGALLFYAECIKYREGGRRVAE
jgi:hypothetical protein